MKRRFLLWLRAFTDRRLAREQLHIMVSIDNKTCMALGSMEAYLLVKMNGGLWVYGAMVGDVPVTVAITTVPL